MGRTGAPPYTLYSIFLRSNGAGGRGRRGLRQAPSSHCPRWTTGGGTVPSRPWVATAARAPEGLELRQRGIRAEPWGAAVEADRNRVGTPRGKNPDQASPADGTRGPIGTVAGAYVFCNYSPYLSLF